MIKDIKDLNQLFKVCRKQGILDIEIDGIKVKFGELPAHVNDDPGSNDYNGDLSGGQDMTSEQLMYYSSGGPSMGI